MADAGRLDLDEGFAFLGAVEIDLDDLERLCLLERNGGGGISWRVSVGSGLCYHHVIPAKPGPTYPGDELIMKYSYWPAMGPGFRRDDDIYPCYAFSAPEALATWSRSCP